MSDAGYIYVMINPSLEGLVKIGKSQRDPEIRAKELSAATGVATPFYVAYKVHFNECARAEQLVHELLERDRVTENREFFKVPLDRAIGVVIKANQILDEDSTGGPIDLVIESLDDDSLDTETSHIADMCDELLTKAEAYINGYGNVLQDIDGGLRLLHKAAKMGCLEAFRELGDIYYYGEDGPAGVNQDKKRARKYFQEGIEHGDETFWRDLGKTYQFDHAENCFKCYKNYFSSSQFCQKSTSLHRTREKANDVRGFLWLMIGKSDDDIKRYIQPLERPLRQDVFLLGYLYNDCQNQTYSGAGNKDLWRLITRIRDEQYGGDEVLEQKCNELLVRARKHLKGLDKQDRDIENPLRKYKQYSSLASLMKTGKEELDPDSARKLLVEAVKLGCKEAYKELGDIFQYGDGVDPDKKKAYSYYSQGLKQGNNECWIGAANLFKWHDYAKWKVCWSNYFKSDSFTQMATTYTYLRLKVFNTRSFLDSIYLWLTSKHPDIRGDESWVDQSDRPEFDFESLYLPVYTESKRDKVFANSLVRLCEIMSENWQSLDRERSRFWLAMAKQLA